ncbi:MAG TPA: acetyl-CoA C-acetyltransferase [Vicinamibacterales bacterium]|nr:acetyl-CoA C-acetyltransferase [Vicinamibacterales bacterium]
MQVADVVIVGAARTPIGRYGGAFRDVHPAELGAAAAAAALERAGVRAQAVDEVVFGHGRQAGSGPNPARQVVRRAGLPDTVPAQTINKACASGMQAVASGAQSIMLGEASLVVAGGIESMSRMPYLIDAEDARWGHRMGHFTLVDAMYRDGFTCSLCGMIMGETAEVLARQYGISRHESDAYAVETQRRAGAAIHAGRFKAEIVPVKVKNTKGQASLIDADEHPRPDTTIEGLRKLPPVFGAVEGHPGIITAGTSSGITDGGAALVLMSASRAAEEKVRPLARVVGWASAAVDPRLMGIGPVPAMRKLFARTGLSLAEFDLVELNEAFAPQVLAVLREEPIPMEKLNVNGGAIALGHPIGCSGARILVTLLYEMERRGARRGLATLCVSGGLGMAMAIERNGR